MLHPLFLGHGVGPGLGVVDCQFGELLWVIQDRLGVGILDVEINGRDDVDTGPELAACVDSSVFDDSLSGSVDGVVSSHESVHACFVSHSPGSYYVGFGVV